MKETIEMKMSKKMYYEILRKTREKTEIKDAFFKVCQEYYWYCLMYEKLQPAIRVLKNYMDEESLLSKASQKKRKNESSEEIPERKVKQELEDHLYAGYFTKIYEENYKKVYSFSKVVDDEGVVEKILKDHFPHIKENEVRKFKKCIGIAYENTYRKVDIEKVQRAMEEYKEVKENTPYPNEEESVRHVLSDAILKELGECLNIKNKDEARAIYSLHKAPVLKALTDGTYHKYTSHNKKEGFYFNIPIQYNLKELKRYIDGDENIAGLEGLYERYADIMDELSGLEDRG